MTDRELLERAAKAAGIPVHVWGAKGRELVADMSDPSNHKLWNPLTDDGDALRLAVQLGILERNDALAAAIREEQKYHDRPAAVRRAIVRIAAESATKEST